MAKERKSPQRKKQLEYTRDHFTFGWNSSRSFPKTWQRKKTHINRENRQKSQKILSSLKPGMEASELEAMADDFTAARFQKSVSRKRLRKTGTVTVGEKVKRKLERRRDAVGRRSQSRQYNDRFAAAVVDTLSSLKGKELTDAVLRADLICNKRNAGELDRVVQLPRNAVDNALLFLYGLSTGLHPLVSAFRRNPELAERLRIWDEKASRILERNRRTREQKLEEKQTARKKVKATLSR